MLGGGQRTARADVVTAHLPFDAAGFLLPAAGDNPLFQNLVKQQPGEPSTVVLRGEKCRGSGCGAG